MKYQMTKNLIIIFVISIFIFSCGKKKEEVVYQKSNVPPKENIENNYGIDSVDDENTPEIKKSDNDFEELKSNEAAGKIGANAIVSGYVADVVVREKVAYLNFDNKYPKNTFTAVIFKEKFADFGDLKIYKNKNVEVTGKINEYRGKAQIILNNKNQIKVIN